MQEAAVVAVRMMFESGELSAMHLYLENVLPNAGATACRATSSDVQ